MNQLTGLENLYVHLEHIIDLLCTSDGVGYIAAFCSTLAFIPQVIKLWKERSARAISTAMYLIYSLSVILWLVYGVMINSIPLIIGEIITLILSVAILLMKYLWKE